MPNPSNDPLRTALAQFFIRVFDQKIKQDRNRPEFDPMEFSEDNSLQQELVNAFKERIGTKWISADRDIYYSIHHYYENYQEGLNKNCFRSEN